MSASTVSPSSLDLLRFVLARLDEEDDEASHAQAITPAPSAEADAVERRRVEVLSRRQVVESVRDLLDLRGQPNEKAVRDHATSILRSLATPYADHPDFRSEWHAATR